MYGQRSATSARCILDSYPGFVTDTKLEGSVRIVTFGNGAVVREPIVTLDDAMRRLVWTAQGGLATHYNSSVQVFEEGSGQTRIV